MIQRNNLFEIGKVLKPHGVGGDLTVLFNKPDFSDIATNFYFFQLEGTFVPFFVEDFRFKSDVTARIKFEGIDTIEYASQFNTILMFVPNEFIIEVNTEVELLSTWDQYIGYTVINKDSTLLGTIKRVDSTTLNVLFIVIREDQEFLIPATNDFILKINSEQKILQLSLPDGLLEND